MIKDYTAQDTISDYLVICETNSRDFKDPSKGKFLSLELGDSTGRIRANWWEWQRSGIEIKDMATGKVAYVEAKVEEFRGKRQLILSSLRLAKDSEYSPDQFLPRSSFSENELKERIRALYVQIKDENIRKLIDVFFGDTELFARYLLVPAAERNHHAYLGGLAEHSCNVAEIVLSLSERYSFLDSDLLIFGGLFHDFGKIESYKVSNFIERSDDGMLLDHIAIGDAEITARAKRIDGFPPELLTKIRHLILSHHGQREYGSPVVPKMPEAFLLNYADEIDSRLEILRREGESVDFSGWSDYIRPLQRSLFFHKKPKENVEASPGDPGDE